MVTARCSKCGHPSLLDPDRVADQLRELSEDAIAGFNSLVALWLERIATQLEQQICALCLEADQPIKRRGPHSTVSGPAQGTTCGNCGCVNGSPQACCPLCGMAPAKVINGLGVLDGAA